MAKSPDEGEEKEPTAKTEKAKAEGKGEDKDERKDEGKGDGKGSSLDKGRKRTAVQAKGRGKDYGKDHGKGEGKDKGPKPTPVKPKDEDTGEGTGGGTEDNERLALAKLPGETGECEMLGLVVSAATDTPVCCKCRCQVDTLRCYGKSPGTWKCRGCNAKAVALTRRFGSWPLPGLHQ